MISILMAVKTGAQYFAEAYASVMAQEHVRWELLVGVNGLPARSAEWESIACQIGHRVRLLDMPECHNKPQAMNAMAKIADGSYIAVLDVDDLWHPWKLAQQLAYIREYDVVGTMGEYFAGATGPIAVPAGAVCFADLLERNCILNSSVVMKREDAVWPETDLLDDYPKWLEMALAGKKIMNLGGGPLVRIRCHPEQWFPKRDNSHDIRQQYRRRAGL